MNLIISHDVEERWHTLHLSSEWKSTHHRNQISRRYRREGDAYPFGDDFMFIRACK
jgi:hypothetical protein